jgi:membrane fusion protein, multidrug efflux system
MSTLPPKTALTPAIQAAATTTQSGFTRSRKIALAAAVFVALAIGAGVYYFVNRNWETTDDAFVEGHIVEMSSKLSNTVAEVNIDDNQRVTKGQLLVRIDPRDYQVALASAQASFDKAQSD